MPLFEVAVIEKPTPKRSSEGKGDRLVLGPKPIMARDAEVAKVLAAKDLPNDVAVDRLEVLVRPFASR